MMFLDEAVVSVESGRGGDGSASFHREKHVPRGGPNGADGGRGGSVTLVANRHTRTLYDVRLQQVLKAGDASNAFLNRSGKDGKDIEVSVPIGTVVFDDVDGEMIADLATEGAKVVVAKGGRGGRGNLHFTNSVRQAPTFAEKGEPGESVRIRLELKLLADVGLIGLPNAGKSTLISVCSAAKPKIADYPFTTIVPNLGVVKIDDVTFTMADMPGLIEGASEGHGLGHQFLRHIERTSVLVHVVEVFPVDGSDPFENYQKIEAELLAYSEELANRPRCVALSKIDLSIPELTEDITAKLEAEGRIVFPLSAVTNQQITPLLYWIAERLKEQPEIEEPTILRPLTGKQTERGYEVEIQNGNFVISGRRVERLVEMTDLRNTEAVRYLHRKLERMGVMNELREAGVDSGDTVVIAGWMFEFKDWG
ncbi:MAG: GTPase ObgE [Fimbriimonadaceae bacterium]|nr:GTPase ObgE [Fimbriimonadaceae bacterium]